MTRSGSDLEEMKSAAERACAAAYAPYSRFRVGAAVRDASGRTFVGCNVENASYGLTQCAERNALAAAIAAGVRDLRTILIYTPGERAHAPCGACRQVIGELMQADAKVVSFCEADEPRQWTVADILPEPFAAEALLGR
jgi:cytidine deaminase